jgi:membrane protein YdbS with pleckstrin-like domain
VTESDPPAAWTGLDPALLRLRRLESLVLVGVLTAGAAGLLGVLVGLPAALAAVAIGAVVLLLLLRTIRRRFASWGWTEREDDLLLRRGVLLQRTTVVPYGRMQFVDVMAGPLDRRFGLATVVLHTAAVSTGASIPGLRTEEATRLRDRLAALGEARAAGV